MKHQDNNLNCKDLYYGSTEHTTFACCAGGCDRAVWREKLPEIGSGLGKAIKNFKQATSEQEETDIPARDSEKNDNKPK
ncbi:hypothetical protein HNQ38_001102 [Desulfovibrio intestinalis]|uniref:Uncharacterized protein n=1 Tax=Desulfovibrio intestinalis TaxID=58621 RepID=A0A7W8FDT4_9BACT|nr:hypothetical protein [Desulfovibrio intestinalis]